MSKKQKQTSFMGNVVIILFAQILVKLLGVVYRMVITNIQGFGDSGNGFYTAGFQVYTVLLAISSVGIPNAIAKLVSERAALGDYRGADRIFKSAFKMFFVIGLVFSALLFLGADFVAQTIIGIPGVSYVMRALAPSIFFVCVSSVIRGYFQGLNDMQATSRSQVYEQIFKCGLTVLLVVLCVGSMPLIMQILTHYTMLYGGDFISTPPEIMAAWANAASSVATALSFIYIVFYYLRKRSMLRAQISTSKSETLSGSTKKILLTILSLSIPISLASIITAVNRVIDTATIARGIAAAYSACIPAHGNVAAILNPTTGQLSDEAVRLSGMLSKSDTIINMPLTLNIAFATVLVPTISAALAKGDKKEAASKTSYSFLISTLLILPCCIGMIVLAKPIYGLLYPNAPMGYDLLALMAVSLIFSALAQTVNGSLQGIGKVFVPAIGIAVGCVLKLILNITLIRIPSVNIYGAAISSIICQISSFLVSFLVMRKYIDIKLTPVKYVVKPLAASAIMGASAIGIYKGVILFTGAGFKGNAIALLAAICAAVIVYAVLVVVMKILSDDEIILLPSGAKLYRLLQKTGLYK